MTRPLIAFLLVVPLGLSGCAGSGEAEFDSDVMLRARILFKNYSGAYDSSDYQSVGAIRNDFRRLNVEGGGVLLAALLSKSEEEQGYAAFALGFSDSRAAVVPLASITSSRNETVRGNAIVALGNLGFMDLPTEPFIRLMKDPLPQVRQAALFGLSLMPLDKDSRDLQGDVCARLTDSDWHIRNEALIVLRRMKRPDTVTAILDGPVQDREPLVRANAALALGAIGRAAAETTPFLIELLKDTDHRVVDGVWTALNKIHDKDFDRSYATWRDWYEDEQKVHYCCPDHREVTESAPGKCPKCGRRLERVSRELLKKVDPLAAPGLGLYVCPEHPDVITTSPARCGVPGCGKDLIPKRPEQVIYVCPDHPTNVTTTPARCGKPGCGKDLVPQKP
jgi:hypothetical protein